MEESAESLVSLIHPEPLHHSSSLSASYFYLFLFLEDKFSHQRVVRQVSGFLTWVKLDAGRGYRLDARRQMTSVWSGSLPTAVISKASLANQDTVSPLPPQQLNGRVKETKRKKNTQRECDRRS